MPGNDLQSAFEQTSYIFVTNLEVDWLRFSENRDRKLVNVCRLGSLFGTCCSPSIVTGSFIYIYSFIQLYFSLCPVHCLSDSIFKFADVSEKAPSRCENVDTFPSFASASPTLLIKNWTLEETVMLNVDISAAK